MSEIRAVLGLAAVLVALGAAHAAPAHATDVCDYWPPIGKSTCYSDPAPTPPPCDVDQTTVNPGERACTPGEDNHFIYQAADPSRPTTGDNRCDVVLRATAPEDQTDAYNRPKIGYRTTVTCQSPLYTLSFTPSVYSATGQLLHTAGTYSCHGGTATLCTTSATLRGDALVDENQAYVVRVPITMILVGGVDPWVETPPNALPGTSDPKSCAPGGYRVDCVLEITVSTQDQTPELLRVGH